GRRGESERERETQGGEASDLAEVVVKAVKSSGGNAGAAAAAAPVGASPARAGLTQAMVEEGAGTGSGMLSPNPSCEGRGVTAPVGGLESTPGSSGGLEKRTGELPSPPPAWMWEPPEAPRTSPKLREERPKDSKKTGGISRERCSDKPDCHRCPLSEHQPQPRSGGGVNNSVGGISCSSLGTVIATTTAAAAAAPAAPAAPKRPSNASPASSNLLGGSMPNGHGHPVALAPATEEKGSGDNTSQGATAVALAAAAAAAAVKGVKKELGSTRWGITISSGDGGGGSPLAGSTTNTRGLGTGAAVASVAGVPTLVSTSRAGKVESEGEVGAGGQSASSSGHGDDGGRAESTTRGKGSSVQSFSVSSAPPLLAPPSVPNGLGRSSSPSPLSSSSCHVGQGSRGRDALVEAMVRAREKPVDAMANAAMASANAKGAGAG
ncbi:unnamed protein product, partial [Discosporangium mesarthrocarpum]